MRAYFKKLLSKISVDFILKKHKIFIAQTIKLIGLNLKNRDTKIELEIKKVINSKNWKKIKINIWRYKKF